MDRLKIFFKKKSDIRINNKKATNDIKELFWTFFLYITREESPLCRVGIQTQLVNAKLTMRNKCKKACNQQSRFRAVQTSTNMENYWKVLIKSNIWPTKMEWKLISSYFTSKKYVKICQRPLKSISLFFLNHFTHLSTSFNWGAIEIEPSWNVSILQIKKVYTKSLHMRHKIPLFLHKIQIKI